MKNVGLNNEEVITNRKKYGTNEINNVKKNSFIKLLIESLGDPIIKILLIALGIKLVFLFNKTDYYETIGILIAVLLASFISSISEYGSEKAFKKLQEENMKLNSRVKRNNNVKLVPIEDIVVGDIIILSSGDKVPADGLIISGELKIDESSLTGESIEVNKSENDKLFRGTVVTQNNAIMKVTSVGINTFYGSIAKELLDKSPESPLKSRLRSLAKFISLVGYIGACLVTFSYLFKVILIDKDFDMTKIMLFITNTPLLFSHLLHALTLAVTIIVVAVPEGLPMMITLVLSSNMKRMLKSNVLIRKLTGIETAGSLNILYTDKTGTITKGNLELTKIVLGDAIIDQQYNKKYYQILKDSLIYNNECKINNYNEIIGGNTTDKAIIEYFKNDILYKYNILNEIPFNSKNKYSLTTINKNNKTTYIKGASEELLKKTKYYYNNLGEIKQFTNKEKIEKLIDKYSSMGIRIILTAEVNNNSLILIALIFLKDEIRKEAIEGLKLVKNANINTIMLTGDNKNTAYAIGKEVGLVTNKNDIVITSKELNKLNDEEIKKMIPNLKIIARSLPSDKSRLIKISQEMGLVTGMTGDGVNDAPALKKANVGFSMGSGTEVSKEASDIVILDDNFLSISNAILFGRTIFKSIRKFIIFQLTINFLAISLSIIGPFIGIDSPVTIMQMLWINMVMDTLAALAFSFEAPLKEYMEEKPKRRTEKILNKYMINEVIFIGLYSVIICLLFLKLPYINNIYETNIKLLTAFFGLFIFMAIFNLFNVRTHRLNILNNIIKNKIFITIIIIITIIQIYLLYFGGSLFRTTTLNMMQFELMIIIAFTIIPIDLFRKYTLRRKGITIGV